MCGFVRGEDVVYRLCVVCGVWGRMGAAIAAGKFRGSVFLVGCALRLVSRILYNPCCIYIDSLCHSLLYTVYCFHIACMLCLVSFVCLVSCETLSGGAKRVVGYRMFTCLYVSLVLLVSLE